MIKCTLLLHQDQTVPRPPLGMGCCKFINSWCTLHLYFFFNISYPPPNQEKVSSLEGCTTKYWTVIGIAKGRAHMMDAPPQHKHGGCVRNTTPNPKWLTLPNAATLRLEHGGTLVVAHAVHGKHGANGTCEFDGCTTNANSGYKHCSKAVVGKGSCAL